MISRIDHFVITVRSLEETCSFYERVLGFVRVDMEGLPTALHFGAQKIHVHQEDRTFEPKAKAPSSGSADFCLVTDQPLTDFQAHLKANGLTIELGPVKRIGALGEMSSVYFRDPDGNLVEVGAYEAEVSPATIA